MQETPNLKLKKPERSDYFDIIEINDNMDTLDTTITGLNTEVQATKKSVSDGKSKVAAAITRKKIPTAADATFDQMANNIDAIKGGSGNAQPSDVLSGRTFSNDGGEQVGTNPNRGAWASGIGFNGRITIPAGHHNGEGYVYQDLPWQGAPTHWLGINGELWLPEGYYAAGAVIRQNIPTHGGNRVTPAEHQQITGTAGHYCTGNVVVDPIPGHYYNVYAAQTVFNYGSYGTAAALGAYYASSSWAVVGTPRPVTILASGGMFQSGISSNSYIIFRAAFPNVFKYVRVSGTANALSNYCNVHVIDPSTGRSKGAGQAVPPGIGAFSDVAKLTSITFPDGGSFWLGIYTNGSMGTGGIQRIELSVNPF